MKKKMFCQETAVISAEEINESLKETDRQYIQGNLQREQILPYVFSDRSEIGISYYREFTHDEAHYHTEITETNYIISGKVCMRILETGEDYVIEAGGIFSVPPGVTHILKIQPETKIIFFKDDSQNDKHVVPLEECNLDDWLSDRNF